VVSHHACRIYSRPSESIIPHVGVVGLTPNPKKLKVASVIIVEATANDATTITELTTFGKMCLKIIRILLAPSERADSTNSFSRNESTSPLTTRAYETHPVKPKTKIMFPNPGPITARTANISKIKGKANRISAMRIMISSTIPPKYPAINPSVTPMHPEIMTDVIPTSKDTRAP